MKNDNRIAVGVFLLLGFVLFGAGLFLIGDRRQLFSSTIELVAEYADLAGLRPGSTVRVAGMDAGEVKLIEAPPSPDQKFKVHFTVIDKLQPIVRLDSVATIQTDGIVGNQYLQVDAGTTASPVAADGDAVQSEEPVQFSDLIDKAKETVEQAQEMVDTVGKGAEDVVQRVSSIAAETETMVKQVRPQVQVFATNARAISDNVNSIVAGVQAGQGLVGKIVKDQALAEDAKSSVASIRKSAEHIEATSKEAQELVAGVRKSDIVGNVDKTIANVRESSDKLKKAVSDFQPSDGEPGMLAEARETLSLARETMQDFSENAEALKHNFFLRGFFKKRGYYDLDEVSVEDYKAGKASPGWETGRAWLAAQNLFETDDKGKERLSDAGKQLINKAVAPFLPTIRDNPILVEGYAAQGDAAEQYRLSHERASLVRDYLIGEFTLRSTYVGTMPMGRVESRDNQGAWRGVALVRFSTDVDKDTRKKLKQRSPPLPGDEPNTVSAVSSGDAVER